MMSLGTLLVKHGWITKQQLGLAISKQREIGGRLGTCLLEMGAITEELLNRSLAEQQGVPTVSAADLAKIEDKVSRLLPAPIAIRYRAVPFRATHSDVDIGMLEVDNLWLQDELSFIVGRRLNVFIANEARIVEALSRYYKAPCSERFVKLLVGLNRDLRVRQDALANPQSTLVQTEENDLEEEESPRVFNTLSPVVDFPPERPEDPERPRRALAPKKSIPLSDEERDSLDAPPATPAETPNILLPGDFYTRDGGAEDEAVSAEVSLESTLDPQEIGRLLLRALSQQFTRVMLLQASPVRIQGWMGEGPGLDEERLGKYAVSFDQPSIFLNLREGGSFFLGELPEMPAHLLLTECWHKDLSDEAGVFPIRVRDRLVALVYGDCGPLGLADLDLDMIRSLCTAAARAFERCIVERKRRGKKAASGK